MDKKRPSDQQRASLRLWLAVLLSVAALWFIDAVRKPILRRHIRSRK